MKSSASCPSLTHRSLLASPPLFMARIVSSASIELSSTSSISTCSNGSMDFLSGQGEIERRALTGLAVGPHPPPMPRHDALHQRETHAGAGKLAGAVQPLEHAEQLPLVARVEARSVVAHEEDVLLLVADGADLDQGLLALGRELQRIREQVGPHLCEQRAVAFRARQ